jgi:hypothetical protein
MVCRRSFLQLSVITLYLVRTVARALIGVMSNEQNGGERLRQWSGSAGKRSNFIKIAAVARCNISFQDQSFQNTIDV